MARKKSPSLYEKIRKIKKAGLTVGNNLSKQNREEKVGSLSDRIKLMENIIKSNALRKPGYIMCFIMYDIENNKVRNQIAKYLIRKGCVRVQKSVYFADIKRKLYKEISLTLKQINAMYDNEDSIFFIPIPEDYLGNLKVIGRNVEFECMTEHKSTLFI